MIAGWSQITARTIGVQKIVPFSQPPFLRNRGFLRVARHRRTDFPRRGAPRGADRRSTSTRSRVRSAGAAPLGAPDRPLHPSSIARHRAIGANPTPTGAAPLGAPIAAQDRNDRTERTKAGRAPTGRAPKPCTILIYHSHAHEQSRDRAEFASNSR